MKTMDDAGALARALVGAAREAGCPATALLTDMNQPLATAAGNALEVIEVMETLTGSAVNHALMDIATALGGEALHIGGLAADPEDGAVMIEEALQSGRAAEVFGEMVASLGGPSDFVERFPDRLPAAPVMQEICLPVSGYVTAIDTHALGMAVVHLGGGRLRDGERINPTVGFSELLALGEEVTPKRPLGMVHAATVPDAERASAALRAAFRVGTDQPDVVPLIHGRVG
jgi:thymidine phosphorylase